MFGGNSTWNGSTVTLTVINEVEVAYQSAQSEGYTLTSNSSTAVLVEGTDARGLLFGIGKLLRMMQLNLTQNYYTARTASATIASGVQISSRYVNGLLYFPRCILRIVEGNCGECLFLAGGIAACFTQLVTP